MKRSKLIYLFFILAGVFAIGFASMSFGQDDTVIAQTPKLNLGEFHDETAFLHVGSSLILSDNKISFLDQEEYSVAATLVNNRTLLPLRALAEYFGAEVSYDAKDRKAIILYDGIQYLFPIGETFYQIIENGNTKTVAMDTKALLLNDRTMVPIRVIAENILVKAVSYKDGVIAISEKPVDLLGNDALVTEVKSKIGIALKAQSAEQIRLFMSNTQNTESKNNIARSGQATIEEAMPEMASDGGEGMSGSSPSVSSDMDVSNGSYSSTNTQVSGIDEGDIVKTDGKYLYIAGNNAVRIVSADKGKLLDGAIIKLADEKYVQEIYVDGNRLVLLGNRNEAQMSPYPGIDYPMVMEKGFADDMVTSDGIERSIAPAPDYYYSKSYSFVDVYDITNPEQPALIKGHEMEGYYQSSRKSGQIVYLITNTNIYGEIVIPMMKDSTLSDESLPINLDDIMIMPECITPGYVVLSAIDIQDNKKTQVEAVTASGQLMYMSESSLYLAADNYDGTTIITKFKIDGMNIGYAGSGKVTGSLLNQFSMDEYQGNLRVATTTWENENALYVLNDSLNVIGSVTGLAKGERIYSARFIGDKGYIVTFRTMDPLFVFDLSVPEDPKVTGELKIPGFSNYLHPVGEDLILGIGSETREIYEKDSSGKEIVIGTRQGGIKLSLFDVSDMGKPREITNYIIGENGSHSEALYNHKAVMVDASSQQVVFDAYITTSKDWNDYQQGALVISYKNKNLSLRGMLDYEQPEVYGKYIPYGRRAVYIGNVLYYIQDGIVKAYDYDTLKNIGSLILK